MVISTEALTVLFSFLISLLFTAALIFLTSHFNELKKEDKGKKRDIKLFVLFLVSVLSILIGNTLKTYYTYLHSIDVNFWVKLLILVPLPILIPASYLILKKSNKIS